MVDNMFKLKVNPNTVDVQFLVASFNFNGRAMAAIFMTLVMTGNMIADQRWSPKVPLTQTRIFSFSKFSEFSNGPVQSDLMSVIIS